MRAEDVVINQRSNRKLVKELVDTVEKRILIFDIFFKLEGTLISKAHILVDLPILVRPSQEHDVLRELDLE